MIHPSTELRFIDSEVGCGVFATEFIPRGTLVWALDPFDLCFAPSVVDALPAPLRAAVLRGSFLDPEGGLIFCWDHGRHVNHSCAPNCVEWGTSFEIAGRDILPGEELTCDYGEIGVLDPFVCRCGALHCRGRIESTPAATGLPAEDPQHLESRRLASSVPQPLLPFAAPRAPERKILRSLCRRSRRIGGRNERESARLPARSSIQGGKANRRRRAQRSIDAVPRDSGELSR